MQLKFIYFAALVIFILKTARANIPGCDFLETVNISSSQKLHNGSYVYQGLLVPPSLTGKYDFIQTELGIQKNVESHVRGCVCKLKPCLWFCCRFKHMQANGKCTDGLMEELDKIKTYVNVTLRNGSVVGGTLPSDFIVLRDPIRPYEIWGSAYEKNAHEVQGDKGTRILLRGYDCIHPNQFRSGNTESLVVAIHTEPYIEGPVLSRPGTTELFWLSEVLLIFTISVSLFVKQLRNLYGKCFICYMIAKFMVQLQWWPIICRIPLQLCALYGYWHYYFLMAKFVWLVAISYHMWKDFTSVNRAESLSFQAHSIFTWGTAAGMTGLIFLIDQIWEAEPNKVKWIFGMAWDSCNLRADILSNLAYVDGPLIILITLSTVFFILTTVSIVKVKLSLKHFSDQNETARNRSSRMETYKMFLRLFIVMDIQASVYTISYIFIWDSLLTISYYFNLCTGIIIFVLFVLKGSTIRLLMESIRNRGN